MTTPGDSKAASSRAFRKKRIAPGTVGGTCRGATFPSVASRVATIVAFAVLFDGPLAFAQSETNLVASPTHRPTLAFNVGAQVRQFKWEEFDEDGAKLLKQDGPLYGLMARGEVLGRVGLVGKGLLYFGNVDYDGHTMNGTPAKTDGDYVGLDFSGDLQARLGPLDGILSPRAFCGLGLETFNRDLKSTATATGYKEEWVNLHGRAGIGCDASLSPDLKAFGEIGWKLPIATSEIVDPGGLDATLRPKQKVSPFIEAGLQYRYFFVSAFYDSLKFDKSDTESIVVSSGRSLGILDVWQPESKSDVYGVNVGLAFRL